VPRVVGYSTVPIALNRLLISVRKNFLPSKLFSDLETLVSVDALSPRIRQIPAIGPSFSTSIIMCSLLREKGGAYPALAKQKPKAIVTRRPVAWGPELATQKIHRMRYDPPGRVPVRRAG
jgi:hypothetical protein